MTDDTDICGAECADGSDCQHPAGSCPVASHSDPDAENNQGRPSKLTDERQEIIVSWIRDLRDLTSAANKADLTYRTVRNWLDEGARKAHELPESEWDRKVEFFQACADARADAKAELLDRMEAPDTEWRAIKWKLERLYQEEFYLPVKQEIEQELTASHEHSGQIDSERSHVIDDETARRLGDMFDAMGASDE